MTSKTLMVLGLILALIGYVIVSTPTIWHWALPFAIAANVCVFAAIKKESSQ